VTREFDLAQEYTRCRSRLIRVAYALVGTHAEAEDVVSDCWPRLVAADARERIEDVEAWATVTVAHAALDVLRSARVRREEYVGPWLPEPLVGALPQRDDPAEQVTLHETGKPVHGPHRVARFLVGVGHQVAPEDRIIPITVNGGPGFALLGRAGHG
jgi:DNA-directed RNA polymerase specialized sigma24 family protein